MLRLLGRAKARRSQTELLHQQSARYLDLSFKGPKTAPFRSRGQKSRVYSLGINPYSHSSEYRPVPCRLETRGVNREIAGERE